MANIWQVQEAFWNSFNIPAYDDQTESEDIGYPHITYESFDGVLEETASLSINLWYRDSTWAAIKQKASEIKEALLSEGRIPFDGGYLWLKVPTAAVFAQPFDSGSADSLIKRILITVEAEALSA